MKNLKKGDAVTWNFGRGQAEGEVEAVFTDKVTKTIKGKSITRKADKEGPAFVVVQEDGGKALKSGSELTRKR